MRFLVVMVSAGAALTLIGASGLMNWVFMTSLGKSELERHILGAVSVAVSALIALFPTLLLWAWRERRIAYLILGVPVFLAFAAFSLSSAVGFAAKNRGGLSDDRARATARLVEVKREITDAEAKLKAYGQTRPLAVVQAALRGLEQDWRWQSSKFCQEATADASRAFCKGYFEQKAEAAKASEIATLETRLDGLKTDARHLEEQGAGREADNQAAVLAGFLGLPAEKVEHGLMLFLAVLVEVGAALGLYFATGHLRPAGSIQPQPYDDLPIIEATVVEEPPRGGPKLVPVRQIGAEAPRRVPRLTRSQP